MFMQKYTSQTYALMRIVAGFLFFCHGAQKLLGMFDGRTAEMFTLRMVAGILEFFGGILIAVGLFTPWTAFIVSGEMAFAYFLSHFMRDGHFWPIQNGGELSSLYSFIFLFMAAKGAGIWSLDNKLRKS